MKFIFLLFFIGCAFGRFQTYTNEELHANVTSGWIVGMGKLTDKSIETIALPKIELDN